MPKAEVDSTVATVADLLVAVGQAKSKGEAKRLIEGGGVSIDDQKIADPFAVLPDKKSFVLHKGKKVHILISVK
jgi:tyrosyl-tRNA synthetase